MRGQSGLCCVPIIEVRFVPQNYEQIVSKNILQYYLYTTYLCVPILHQNRFQVSIQDLVVLNYSMSTLKLEISTVTFIIIASITLNH